MSKVSVIRSLKKYITMDNVIFAIILSSMVFYLIFQVFVLKTATPQVAVTTTSMVPTYEGFNLSENPDNHPIQYYDILRGDLLIIQNIEPHVGDVVVFNVSSELVPIVHRLIAERIVNGTQEFATKGDHNPTTDASTKGTNFGWIKRSDIYGVVVFSIHHLGWFSLLLQINYVKYLLIIAIGVIILFALFGNSNSEKESEIVESSEKKDIKKRTVCLNIKSKKIQIHRPKLFVFLLMMVILTTYIGIGFVNYNSGTNNVQLSFKNNDIIDLSSPKNENFTTMIMVNYVMNVSSSGLLNTVNRVEITPVYNNVTTDVINPTYVWTIVYDYAGTKLIHPVLIFSINPSIAHLRINTTINIKVFSTGLLASPIKTSSIHVTILT